MTLVAGVDIGNATTEVAVLDGGRLLGADRLPTRGRKGSAESVRGAAALVRRIERRLGRPVDEARIAPLRAADTATLAVPAAPPHTGRLRVLAAGVATPGGTGTCIGAPLWLDRADLDGANLAGAQPDTPQPDGGRPGDRRPRVVLVPPGLGYAEAARRLRALLAAGVPAGAVLAASDEGVLIANRLDLPLPVIDQVNTAAAGTCALLAVEVRGPGQPLTTLTDPVALGAELRLPEAETGDAVTLSRSLLDYSNAVIGLDDLATAAPATPAEPWVVTRDGTVPLRAACAQLPGWPVGSVKALGTPAGQTLTDDLFALDLAAVADTATARRGSMGRTALVASLQRLDAHADHAGLLSSILDCPVHRLITEPAGARLGACTTPGARPDAVVVDVGAGTIDVIAPDGEVVAAGAGELLTAAVAETIGLSRAAADWVKRGPCVRVTGSQQFEAEDGRHGFLDRPADSAVLGMLAAAGPAGLLPFDRGHTPAEWRAIRLRLKEAVFAANLLRAVRTLGRDLRQVLIVGGPAGDDELLGVLLRALPDGVSAGRANVGGTLAGTPAGHRHAAALGLALATRPSEAARALSGTRLAACRRVPQHLGHAGEVGLAQTGRGDHGQELLGRAGHRQRQPLAGRQPDGQL
jgi:Diol dehydratase reactivase ATPase-like domain/DD-reactivating factor swiveling domain